MAFLSTFTIFLVITFSSCSSILCQQPYARKSTTACAIADNSTSVVGYSCNGVNPSCQSYLTFRSQPPYNSVSSISTLLYSDPSHLSRINSVPENQTFETDSLVLVPVNCSCSGQYYQANTSYVIEHEDTHFLIANNTFQGLSTCQAIRNQNRNNLTYLYTGDRISVPLRCACPTRNQSDEGFKYLLSYVVTWGDFVSSIASRFGADTGMTLEANDLSETDATIYPFTTLLVPLQNPPSSSQTKSPPPPPSTPSLSSPSKGSSNRKWVYVVVGVVVANALVLAFCFLVFFHKRKRRSEEITASCSFEAREKPQNKALGEEDSLDCIDVSSIAQSLKIYKFGELQSATGDFSSSCLIGGSVYRGTINGDLAAIKKMSGDVSKEINLLNKISHFNLIDLSGVCFDKGHWYLVYEYVVNGALSEWLYGKKQNLRWMQRMQIAVDVATGLNYLHSFTSPPLVHKDLKSSNILLDSDFRAKIANLGLSRSAEGREGQFSMTSHIVGTRGYMAPEYLENGLVSTKLDVYAFGVMVLEMITGKEATDMYEEGHGHLSDVVNAVLEKQDLSGFIDPNVEDAYPSELGLFLVKMVGSWLSKNPAARPAMDEILVSLSNVLRSSLNWEYSANIAGKPTDKCNKI